MKNLNSQLPFATLVIFTLCLWTTAYGQITPSGDAYTNTATPTVNLGTKPLLVVESASQTTYIQFDLSSIPSGYTGASIAKATLKLYVNAVTTAGSFNVDYVNGTWSEKTITADLAPALGTTIVSSVPLTSANVHDYVLIDITSAVGAWLDGTEPNDGIALVGNSPLNASFDSKENTANSHPAELDIVFAGGGTISGVTTAGGSGLIGGGTSGTLNLGLTNACAANQVLQWNGSSWACASVGTGTITGVTAGTDLTGGGASGNVTLNLNTTALNSVYPQLATANAFTGNQTVNGNVSATGVVSASAFYDSVGTQVLSISPGLFNLYVGQSAGQGSGANNTGSDNTSTGFQTLFLNTTGSSNAALGAYSLYSNTTGSDNTASGFTALYRNTTGTQNTASGYFALAANTTGTQNTADGVQALVSNTTGGGNTATGLNALYSNTPDGTNTADGDGALYGNTTGSNNTASGFLSGGSVDGSPITGSHNSLIGANSVLSIGALNNASAIGASAEVAESNAMVLGSINGVNGAT